MINNIKLGIAFGLVSLLSGCFNNDEIILSKEQVVEVGQLQVKNFACYYYGEYSSDLEAPTMVYEHLEYAESFTSLLTRWANQQENLNDGFATKVSGIKEELKASIIKDIETAENEGLSLTQNQESKGILGDCRGVRFASKRMVAKLEIE